MRGGDTVYNYIRDQWIMAAVTADWVMACVPKFITDVQCATILAMPQNPQTRIMSI